jgi:cell division cycle 14
LDNQTIYIPFYKDFGPPNTAVLYRFCQRIHKKMLINAKVVFYSQSAGEKLTNSVFLMAAYCIMIRHQSVKETRKQFQIYEEYLIPFRDAGSENDTFGLTVWDCIAGLDKGKKFGWIDLQDFNVREYEHFERVENGDLNWIIPGKIMACASPTDTPTDSNYVKTHPPATYIELFKRFGVNTLIRLNEKIYNAQHFEKVGVEHFDLYFDDGTTPSTRIVHKFIEILENDNRVVAVHCKQGLGRTGTLNACYLMKYYDINTREIIGFTRVQRPGSIVGVQQFFLEKMEPLIKKSVRKPGFTPTLSKSTDSASKSEESLEESDTALTTISTIARKRKFSSSQTK